MTKNNLRFHQILSRKLGSTIGRATRDGRFKINVQELQFRPNAVVIERRRAYGAAARTAPVPTQGPNTKLRLCQRVLPFGCHIERQRSHGRDRPWPARHQCRHHSHSGQRCGCSRLRSDRNLGANATGRYQQPSSTVFPPHLLSGRTTAGCQQSSVARDLLEQIMTALGAQVALIGRSDTFVSIDTEVYRTEDWDIS